MQKNDNLHDFIQPLKQVTLEPQKALQMREVLSAYADLHSTPARTGLYLSPFTISPRVWGVVMAAFVLLIGSTGVTFAAQTALPGEPLYVVKVKVSEPIQGALAVTPVQKATWSNELADRRLSEASELAASNLLNASTTVYIQTQVQTEVDNSSAVATTLADSGNADAALSVRSDLDARLTAHADVLALITPRLIEAGDASTTEHVLAILDSVHHAQDQIATARVQDAIAIATTNDALPAVLPQKSTDKIAMNESAKIADSNASETARVAIALSAPAMGQPDREHSLFRAHIEALLKALPVATTTASTTSTSTASSIPITSGDGSTATSTQAQLPDSTPSSSGN
jgi:hypothetical protein